MPASCSKPPFTHLLAHTHTGLPCSGHGARLQAPTFGDGYGNNGFTTVDCSW